MTAWAVVTGVSIAISGCREEAKVKEVVETAKGLYQYDPTQAVHKFFSGAKAMEYVQAQVDIGPRPSGSEGAERARQHLETTLKSLGWETQRQEFTDYTPKGNIKFANVRARFPMPGSETWRRNAGLLVGSHYDTKLFSAFPFVGANDAGSSTGALLEMGRVLSMRPALAQFVELVFFDGEEALVSFDSDQFGLPKDGLYGSRHYVKELRKQPMEQAPLGLLLLDMIGEKDLRVELPQNSHPGMRQGILAAAAELGYQKHFAEGPTSTGITDDHLPFHVAGLPTVDVIDINYSVWHTQGDTMDKLAPESLEMAGRTALLAIEKTFLGNKLAGRKN